MFFDESKHLFLKYLFKVMISEGEVSRVAIPKQPGSYQPNTTEPSGLPAPPTKTKTIKKTTHLTTEFPAPHKTTKLTQATNTPGSLPTTGTSHSHLTQILVQNPKSTLNCMTHNQILTTFKGLTTLCPTYTIAKCYTKKKNNKFSGLPSMPTNMLKPSL